MNKNNKNYQYDQDFYAWALHSADLLRQGKFKEIDVEHMAEEIESMGKRDRRQLVNRLAVLIAHLLKWQFQPELRGRSWKLTIREQRIKVAQLLDDSPSLNHELVNKLNDAYAQAIVKAAREADLMENNFPEQCPYSLDQCLDGEFFPT